MTQDLTALTPKLLAQGLLALRSTCIMPRLVNRDYDMMAAQHGSSVDIPIPAKIAVQDVAPAATPPSTADITPTSVSIPLDQWKEAPFYLTDKDMLQAMNGTIPLQASEAVASLANTVDAYILGLYKGVYGWVGTAGMTPFTVSATDVNNTTKDAADLAKVLNLQLAPMNDRRAVLDPTAEAKALGLPAFASVNMSGTDWGIKEGQLNRKLGFDWFMDQNVPTHTLTGGAGYLVNMGSGQTVGATTVTVDTGSTPPAAGDVFTVAGDTQTYVVKSVAGTTWTFAPAAKVAWADNAAITFKASHVVNLAFQRNAIAFATRPLEDTSNGALGVITQSAVDPVSGLTLRLEITREHKRTRFSYDILYGGALVRPELACRLAG